MGSTKAVCSALSPALVGCLAAQVQGCQCCVARKPTFEFKGRFLWGKGKSFHRSKKRIQNPRERGWEHLESKGSPGSAVPSELGRLCGMMRGLEHLS